VKKRLFYIGIGITIILVAVLAYIRLTAAPIHAFDQSWGGARDISVDSAIRTLAQKAQLDDYVSGIPPIGRTQLVLESASRADSGVYYLFFYPKSVSDTLVVYCFRGDGKILWKTCTWTGT
jgi:hypothetical protein